MLLKLLTISAASCALLACTTVSQVGEIGPKKLKVYSVSHHNFLSSTDMIVVLDEQGNVSTSTGGTVAGAGTIGLQAVTTTAQAAATYYGAKALQHGIEHVGISGIPSNVNVNANANITAKADANVHATGEILQHG